MKTVSREYRAIQTSIGRMHLADYYETHRSDEGIAIFGVNVNGERTVARYWNAGHWEVRSGPIQAIETLWSHIKNDFGSEK